MTALAVDPFADASALANRIAQHLKAHPDDRQAREDLRYVVSQMKQAAPAVSAADNPPEASVGAQVASGLASVPGDVIKGLVANLTSRKELAHTLGQVTGVANIPQYLATARDPDASNAEKIAAAVQATPLNAGYAPFRAFLQSLGAKTDEPPAPLSEQVRQGGDIAANLLLMRYGGPAVKRVARAGNAMLGGVPARVMESLRSSLPKPNPMEALQREMQAGRPPETPVSLDALRAMRDFEAGKISGQDLRVAMDVAAGRTPEPMGLLQPSPLTPMPGVPRGLLGPEGISPAPRTSYPPTLAEMQGLDTSPLKPTAAEAGATATAKALRAAARAAARAAYNKAVASGMSLEDATIAARWAATHINK